MNNSTVTATYTCTDTVSGVAACSPPQSTGTNEGAALALTGTAKDLAGLTASISSTVKVDHTPPTDPVVTVAPASRPSALTSAITATSSDALSGLAGGEWWIGADPGVGTATRLSLSAGTLTGVVPPTVAPGSYVVSVRALDVAGNWSGVGTAGLTVTSPNTAPTAAPQTVTTAEDTAATIVLTGTDPDAADVLTFTVVSQPAHGVLSGTAPNLTYTPAANFNGADSFTFKINDGSVDSNTATVSIAVTPVNDSPVADATSVTTAEDTPVVVTLSGTDVDGDPLTFAIVTQPTHGTLSGAGASRTYSPAANFNGSDSFTFSVNDGLATSAPATVSLTVTAVNDLPVANAASVSAITGQPTPVTLSGSDVDGDTLTFVIVTSPAHGTLTGIGPTFSYTSAANFAGSDSFSFAVSDGQSQSSTVTVPITVTAPSLGLTLLVADSATRTTNPRPLDGVTLRSGFSAYIYVGTAGLVGVRQVSFSLDGIPFTVDRAAPFDFAGTSNARACRSCALSANPFESNLLSLGMHHVTATVLMRSGLPVVLDATFTIADTTPHSLAVSSSSNRSSPAPLNGATLSGQRFMFLAGASDPIAGLSRLVFVLDGRTIGSDTAAPYDAFGTRRGLAVPFDTRRLRNGNHRLVAIVQLVGGGRIVYSADFRVAN